MFGLTVLTAVIGLPQISAFQSTPFTTHINPSARKQQSFHLRRWVSTSHNDQEQITVNGSETNNEHENIDRAPCFDGICSSDPIEPEETSSHPGGEATQRLGTMTGPTVWSEFGRIAAQNPDIANLGQGFPDWLPPQFAIDALVECVTDVTQSPHQYTRTAGHVNLVKELAGRYSVHMDHELDPMSEVAITVGASQALYLSLQTLIQPGDEVILFEPFFDLYVNQIKLAGGTPVFVPLKFQPYDDSPGVFTGGDWVLEPESLDRAITSKTRAIVLNSPHNPTGKIFTRSEMESIANSLTNNAPADCVVLSDEVYKYIVHSPPKDEMEEEEAALFEKSQDEHSDKKLQTYGDYAADRPLCQGHVHFATLPGMWDRTITISSAGKTFSATGWQVGWAIGPSKLIAPIHQLLPYVQFCASTVVQEALARTLAKADQPYEGYSSYYEHLKAMYTRKRDLLGDALKSAGFAIPDYDSTPGGGFFIFARIGNEIAKSIPPERLMAHNAAAPGNIARQDWALCEWLAEEKGILCIPASPFFSGANKDEEDTLMSDQFVRIAFCKTDETIKDAARALRDMTGIKVPLTEDTHS